jgi:hypothetical protein
MAAIRSASELDSHDWSDSRQLVTREMGTIGQLQCRRCGRDFILVTSTGAVQAVAIGVLSFWVLSPEVTLRWCRECPGEVLASDDDDRLKRVAEVTLFR